ncbi:MAG: SH3 domain-containing protein [bacterium]
MRNSFFPLLTSVFIITTFFHSFPGHSEALTSTMYVTAIHWINMRSEPNMGSEIIARAKSGEPIKILDQKGGWCYIRTPKGEEGWSVTTLLTKEKPLEERFDILTRRAEEQSRLIAKLGKENATLKKYIQSFKITDDELKHLRETNSRLKSRKEHIWAAFGAALLLLGWIVGMITRAFPWRKRARYRYVID